MVTCPTCSKVFTSETKLKRHQDTATCRVINETQKNRVLQYTITELKKETECRAQELQDIITELQEEIKVLKAERDQFKTEKDLLHELTTKFIQNQQQVT